MAGPMGHSGLQMHAQTIRDPLPKASGETHRMPTMPQDSALAPPEVLLIGHVTRDIMDGQASLGGTVAFAARAASCLGVACAVVTAAPPAFALLEPLRRDPRIELVEVPARRETTFHLSYTEAGRSLSVSHRAPELRLSDVPQHLRRMPLAFIAPLLGECGRDVVEGLGAQVVLCTIQGWLRKLAPGGEVMPALSELVARPPGNLNVVVFSELDHPDSDAIAQQLAAGGVLVALTRSTAGVSLYTPERLDVPAAPAVEVDPTGAGDVFGLVFGLALAAGRSPLAAAQQAVVAAARVVEGPGLGNLGAIVHGCQRTTLAS
jgi:1D-myo-inositol 3-kinase